VIVSKRYLLISSAVIVPKVPSENFLAPQDILGPYFE
jgi:hypothetical protein